MTHITAILANGEELSFDTGASRGDLEQAIANRATLKCEKYTGQTVLLNLSMVAAVMYFEKEQ